MSNILIFFVLPVATIILSIVLLKILKCPILVAATFFAVYLILAFTIFDTDFLIFAIIYTILSYITAFLAQLIYRILNRLRGKDCFGGCDNQLIVCDNDNTCNCEEQNNTQNVVLNAEFTPNSNNNGRTGCFKGCYKRRFF